MAERDLRGTTRTTTSPLMVDDSPLPWATDNPVVARWDRFGNSTRNNVVSSNNTDNDNDDAAAPDLQFRFVHSLVYLWTLVDFCCAATGVSVAIIEQEDHKHRYIPDRYRTRLYTTIGGIVTGVWLFRAAVTAIATLLLWRTMRHHQRTSNSSHSLSHGVRSSATDWMTSEQDTSAAADDGTCCCGTTLGSCSYGWSQLSALLSVPLVLFYFTAAFVVALDHKTPVPSWHRHSLWIGLAVASGLEVLRYLLVRQWGSAAVTATPESFTTPFVALRSPGSPFRDRPWWWDVDNDNEANNSNLTDPLLWTDPEGAERGGTYRPSPAPPPRRFFRSFWPLGGGGTTAQENRAPLQDADEAVFASNQEEWASRDEQDSLWWSRGGGGDDDDDQDKRRPPPTASTRNDQPQWVTTTTNAPTVRSSTNRDDESRASWSQQS